MEGKRSPWGVIQYSKKLADGITAVSCAGHGGIKLNRERNAQIPKGARRASGWYEEDCEVGIVFLVFTDEFDRVSRAECEASLKNYLPEEYTAITGKPVTLEESWTLRHRAEREEAEAAKRSPKSRLITSATITAPGDMWLGIPDCTMELCHIDMDLNVVTDPEAGRTDESVCNDLRQALRRVAQVVTGLDNATVFLSGYDEPEAAR